MKKRSRLAFRLNCEGYFIDKKGNILARKENGIIIFPGGGILDREDISNGILRETFEETGAIITGLKKLGKIKIVWGPRWAKTRKQIIRTKKFQGDEMHFFFGFIQEIKDDFSIKEDSWSGNKLIKLEEVISGIKRLLNSEKELKEYRETQLKYLNELKNEKI